MKLGNPRLWIALFSTSVVVTIAIVDVGKTSPGPLSMVHGVEAGLATGSSCSACHGGWFESMTNACLECHQRIENQIGGSFGLHGAQVGIEHCSQCHSDHHGLKFPLINERSFGQLGIPNREDFDHARIGWEMGGAHAALGCVDCHENAEAKVLSKGELRFLGLEKNCASCHEDPHGGTMLVSCASCHGQESWARFESLGHDNFVPLAGGHARMRCDDCHAGNSFFSLDVEGRGMRKGAPRQCADCHDSPHSEGFVESVAGLEGMTQEASCRVCHLGDHETFRDEDIPVSTDQHALTGFPLGRPHDTIECADCHRPYMPRFRDRYPGRTKNECHQCHADPHDAQFKGETYRSQDCLACHEATHFEPHAFDQEKHGHTKFALTGIHQELDCDACHEKASLRGARLFNGTDMRCEACHADAHAGFFDHQLLLEDSLEEGTCAHCHGTEGFEVFESLTGRQSFDHERWTGFEIDGAHAETSCEFCHPQAEAPDELGRRFGRVAEHFGDVEGCLTCHSDPHDGAFEGWNHPLEVEGRKDCARCHATSSFRAFPDGFDHRTWTGFPLTGTHRAVDCSACHAPLLEPTEGGRTWDHAVGNTCAACHVEPHAGQFASRKGETDCQRCHTARGSSFSELVFDHDRHSRFALGDAHADLGCAACHSSWDLGGGNEVVRYRPLKHECVDCHGTQLTPMRKGGRRR